jgi:opacity protein-like surface antigen
MKTPLAALPLAALLGLAAAAQAAEPERPPWAATVRAGAFLLNSPAVPGHPAGPDVEVTLGRTLYEQVSVEVNAGHYRAALGDSGTDLAVTPLSVSLRVAAPLEHGFEPFAVIGLGWSLTELSGGALAAPTAWRVAYHAGLGVRRRFGELLFAGLEGRYVFQDVGAPLGRLDGLRLSALAGLLF